MSCPLVDAFAAALRAAPGAAVAWTASGLRRRADLDAAAAALAPLLDAVPPGSRIGLSVRCPFTFLAAALLLWRRGDAAVLLDAADPLAPRADLAALCRAGAVLTDQPALRVLPLPDGAPAGELRAIKLTSGSTDTPRAVGVDAAALLADAAALDRSMGIGDADRVFAAVPMSFSYGVGSLLVPALARGRCLVLPEPGHPLGVLQALRHGAPTVLPAVPALLRALLDRAVQLPASLRLVLSAGAVLPAATAAQFRQRFGRAVHVFYGATETGGIAYDRTGTAAERGSVGTPVDGVAVAIEADGRVRVRGPAVGRPLVADPAFGPDGFLTADLGAYRDGELVLLGRAGEAFDVGGHKVHPREVERVILDVPGVTEAVVLRWTDPTGRAAAAALVAAPAGLDEAVVRQHCVARLPGAKVPRCVRVVAALPRNSRGKLVRAEVERLLHDAAADGAP